MSILRLVLFSDKLSSFSVTDGERDGRNLSNWQEFIDGQFALDGRMSVQPIDSQQKTEIPKATLPRFFWMYFETGASSLRLHTENGREQKLPQGRCRVNCESATLAISYPNGARVELSGPLNVMFGADELIEYLEFQMLHCEEHLSRTEVEKVLTNFSPQMSNTKSPKMAKNKLPKAQQKLQQQNESLTIDHFPKAPRGQGGMTMRMLQFLEVCADRETEG